MKHTLKLSVLVLLVATMVLSVCLMASCGCGDPIGSLNDELNVNQQVNGVSKERGEAQETGKCDDGLTWTLYSNGELVLTGEPKDGTMYDYVKNTKIPAWRAHAADIRALTLDDKIKVISEEAFSSLYNLVWVQFGKGVETIGVNAFRSCSNLRRIILPKSVKTISAGAFNGCYRMYEARLNDGLTNLGANAFAGCRSLVSVTFPKSLSEKGATVAANVFTDSVKLVEVITECSVRAGSTSLGGVAKYAASTAIHNGETQIANQDGFLIYNKNRLMGYIGEATEITVPATITTIDPYAFFAQTGLTSVDTGTKVTTIKENAFASCSGIETLTIGVTVNNIGTAAFDGCVGIKTINYKAKSYGSGKATDLFANLPELTAINFDAGVTKLPASEGMFRGCTALTSVTLPGVEDIPAAMFEGCSALEEVIFNGKNESIGERAFKNCTSLKDLDLTKLAANSSIAEFAFDGCTSIVSVDLEKVTRLKDGAFNACSGLTGVVTGTKLTLPSGAATAFEGCVKLIDIVNNTTNTYVPGATGNGAIAKYTTFAIGKGDARIKDENGFLFFEDTDANYLVGYVGDETALTFPANYKGTTYTVYENAFNGNKTIESVSIGAGVTAIGERAFRDCVALTRVDFTGCPVTELKMYTFDGCERLTTLTLSDSIETIASYAFRDTKALGEVDISSVTSLAPFGFQYSGLTKLTAGEGLTAIEHDAFSGCDRLVTATIPGAETIGNQAFANCAALKQVSMPRAKVIGEYAFYHCISLGAVELPAGERIEQCGFEECTALTQLTIGENLASIGASAFAECGRLVYIINHSTHLTLVAGDRGPGNITRNALLVVSAEGETPIQTQGDFTYMTSNGVTYLLSYNGTATEITTPDTLGGNAYEIHSYAFYGSKLKSVNVKGATLVGYAAFAYSDIEKVTLPGSVVEIANNAFEASALREITLAEGLTTIGDDAFKNAKELRAVKLPNSLTKMGMAAFRNCASLRNVEFGTGLEKIPSFAFDGCVSIGYLKLPINIANFGTRWYYGCLGLVEIETKRQIGSPLKLTNREEGIQVTEGSSSKVFTDADGFVFYSNTDSGVNYLIGYEGTETNLVLPKKCKSYATYQIFDYAFYNRDDIETVQIPESVTGIGKHAFAECDNLKGIYIPSTVKGHEEADMGVREGILFGGNPNAVIATGFASAEETPAFWSDAFNQQSDVSSYKVAYGVTYDIFLTMLK